MNRGAGTLPSSFTYSVGDAHLRKGREVKRGQEASNDDKTRQEKKNRALLSRARLHSAGVNAPRLKSSSFEAWGGWLEQARYDRTTFFFHSPGFSYCALVPSDMEMRRRIPERNAFGLTRQFVFKIDGLWSLPPSSRGTVRANNKLKKSTFHTTLSAALFFLL